MILGRARAAWLTAVVAGLAALPACTGGAEGGLEPTDPDLGFQIARQDPGGNFTIEVDFALGSCTAAVECKSAEHGAPASLLTALTCAFPSGNTSHDALLTFERRLRCYDSGTLSNRSSWSPSDGNTVATSALDEHVYSGAMGFFETLFFNSTQKLAPMDAYAFCHYEAMALLRVEENDTDARAVVLRDNPLRFNWDMLLEVYQNGTWDCHKDDNLSGVTYDFPRASVHGLPSNTTKLHYPVTHDWAVLEELTLSNNTTSWLGERVVYHVNSTFPASTGPADEYDWRDLWITDENGTPIDSYIDTVCAQTNQTSGELIQIGLLLRDNSTHAMLGALGVFSDLNGSRFQCERNSTTGACLYGTYTGAGNETNCLDQLD